MRAGDSKRERERERAEGMAARRRLGRLFSPRASTPAPAPRPTEQRAGAAAGNGGWDTRGAPAALPWGLRLRDCVVFQCRGCRAVLGDALHLCGEETKLLRVLVCSRVTHDVVLEESLLVGIEGALTGSTYHRLSCRSCKLGLGFHLYSSSAALASWRGLFCLAKDKIVCYLLETKCTVEASEMTFPTVDIGENIEKLRGQIVAMHGRLEALTERLVRLTS
ncbi:protein Mis18-beta [Ornithorhynchus anatinus]|uniref:protein Mis18-beta n=1 Tax=Ornithorhynchus anatinus TaxID=9258 RepID=UPI0010A8E9CF|nr:protein Mis18-beta [Ornithorhynchus anatinus]